MSAATFHLCADRRSVLEIECRPGTLHSSAAPPEGWKPPPHPFIHGVATDPMHESRLAAILRQSESASDFLGRAIAAGYDVAHGAAWTGALRRAYRIHAADGALIGVLWWEAGPFATLSVEAQDATEYPQATVTAYAASAAPALLAALEETDDDEGLKARFAELGYTLAAAK